MWRPYWVAVPNITIKEDKFMLFSQLFYWQLEDWIICDLIKFQICMWSLKLLKQEDVPTVWSRSYCRTSFCSNNNPQEWKEDVTALDKVTGQDIVPHSFSCSYFLSVSLSYFNFAVPMRKCFGKHSWMSSPLSIAILIGTCSLWAPILLCGDVPAKKQLNYKQSICCSAIEWP